VSNFAHICRTDLHEIFREGWQRGKEQIIKFRWDRGYMDCFSDLSLLGDTESGTNRLPFATLQSRACTSSHRHSNSDRPLADVCTDPVLLGFICV